MFEIKVGACGGEGEGEARRRECCVLIFGTKLPRGKVLSRQTTFSKLNLLS